MTLQQAIAYGEQVGVSFYVYNSNGRIVGGTKTREQAEAMKRRLEAEDRGNPFTRGSTRYEIKPAK